VAVAAGGIAIGIVVGWLAARLRIAAREPSVDVVLSVLTPFAAYVPAERVGASGVLAVVTAGVYIGARSLEISEAGSRLRTLAFWQASEFLLNSLLFLLIGLQVTRIVGDIEGSALATLVGEAGLVALTVVAIRFAWMFALPELADLSVIGRSYTNRRERVLLAWSGMRGAVSLAAALAIPVAGFPDRSHVIFLAYGVVVLTLAIPGLTLAPLIERLGLGQSEERRRQEVEARLRLTHAALERLEQMAEHGRGTASSSGCATATSPGSIASRTASTPPAAIPTTAPTRRTPRSRCSRTSVMCSARCGASAPSRPSCCAAWRRRSTSTRRASARAAASGPHTGSDTGTQMT
jgi:CPA1 family monovalent cation:H+ antiporter